MRYALESGSHNVYSLQYHFVTVTKYRTPLLNEEIIERVREIAHDLAPDFQCKVIDLNGDKDHLHLLFKAAPKTDMIRFINSFKGVSSRYVRKEYPAVTDLVEDGFWQPGYFLATTGQVTLDQLVQYMEDQ